MIIAQTIVDRIKASLDAENSDRYLFDQDFKPAINFSQEWLVAAFNAAFGAKKLSEESLRELTKIKVWQANDFSRIAFGASAVGHKLWTLFAVFPKPILHPSQGINPLTAPYQSSFQPDKTFVKSEHSAKRLTLEEWNENRKNPFVAGNEVITQSAIIQYSYLNFIDYSSTTYTPTDKIEIEVRPAIPKEYVALAYLKYPTPINLITDAVEFPDSLIDLMVEKCLSWISYKQGDGTSIYLVSEKDLIRLINFMS